MAIKEVVQVQFDIKDNASAPTKKLGGLMSSLFSPAAIASAAIAGIGFAVGKMISAAEESRKVMAQTEAVLKSTGGAAGVSAEQVARYATELSRMTNFDDEAIQSAENLLLTFTKVGKEIFPQATETILDMSVALGQDAKSSAIQLGKALQDPIAGITALRRVGVAFTEQQKNQIQALVESGRSLDAQKLILKELSVEFGGSAKAAASGMTILKNSLGNIGESIGGVFLPVLDGAARSIARLSDSFVDSEGKGGAFKGLLIETAGALNIILSTGIRVVDAIRNIVTVLGYFYDALKIVGGGAKDFIASIPSGMDAMKGSISRTEKTWGDFTKKLAKEDEAAIKRRKEIWDQMRDIDKDLKNIKDGKPSASKSTAPVLPQTPKDEEPPSKSFDSAIKLHEEAMSKLRADSKYTIDAEIASYELLRAKYAELGDQKADIGKKINDLTTKQNEETTKRTLELMDREFQAKKALGQTTVDDEIAFEQSKLGVKNLSEQQKQAIDDKTYQAKTQKTAEQLAANQYLNSEEQNWAIERDRLAKAGISKDKQDTKTFLDSARALGEGKLTIDEFVNQGLLENKKKEAIAWADIEAAKLVNAGLASLATLNPFGFLQIAAGGALAAGVRAAANSIKLAKGGTVMPSQGGTLATIGEAGKPERVAPLDPNGLSQRDYAMIDYLAGGRQGGGVTEITVMLPDKTVLAKAIYREQQRLINTGQLSGAR